MKTKQCAYCQGTGKVSNAKGKYEDFSTFNGVEENAGGVCGVDIARGCSKSVLTIFVSAKTNIQKQKFKPTQLFGKNLDSKYFIGIEKHNGIDFKKK